MDRSVSLNTSPCDTFIHVLEGLGGTLMARTGTRAVSWLRILQKGWYPRERADLGFVLERAKGIEPS